MRTLSNAAINALSNNYSVKPLNLVKVYWDNPVVYGEKEAPNIKGKLLSLSPIDDVINVQGSSNSVSLSIELDDSDGSIKTIFDNVNIHGVKVDILQSFEGFNLGDAFIIFQGKIASPIEYKVKGKTLSFDVLSEINNREIGFSIEEGQFTDVPAGTVGKMWPLIFGTVASVPALPIAETPSAIMATGTGILVDEAWDQELNALRLAGAQAHDYYISEFTLGLQEAYLAAAERSGTTSSTDPFGSRIANSHDDAARQHFLQADQYRQDEANIGFEIIAKEAERREQQKFVLPGFKLVSSNIPANTLVTLRAGDAYFTGKLSGDYFAISSREIIKPINDSGRTILTQSTGTLSVFTTSTEVETRDKFYWIGGGTQLQVNDFPLKYVLGIGQLNIKAIKSKQNGLFVALPPDYYTIAYETFGPNEKNNSLVATTLILKQPLTSYNNDVINWESNDIYSDVVGSLSNNVVEAMIYIINNFTDLTYDVTTFTEVRNLLINYPANFVVLNRINALEILRDMAFQTRCQIWINDRKFYLRYLPKELSPVKTLTYDDVHDTEEEYLTITTTETEDLVTKFVAEWRADFTQSEAFKIIYRNNVANFGVQEETYDFYLFNNIESVKKSAEYWSIQKSNLWKIVRFSTYLQHLELESFDAVTLDFPAGVISSGPVVGLIIKATFNPSTHLIDLEIKLPVRFGELNVYPFAYPKDVTEIYPRVTDDAIDTGNPLSNVPGDITNGVNIFGANVGLNTLLYGGTVNGRNQEIGDQFDSPNAFGSVTTILDPSEVTNTTPTGLSGFNNIVRYDIKNPKPISTPQQAGSSSYAGIVKSRVGNSASYNVDVYLTGINGLATPIVATQFAHPDEDSITPETPVVVYSSGGAYFMLVPVWMQYE